MFLGFTFAKQKVIFNSLCCDYIVLVTKSKCFPKTKQKKFLLSQLKFNLQIPFGYKSCNLLINFVLVKKEAFIAFFPLSKLYSTYTYFNEIRHYYLLHILKPQAANIQENIIYTYLFRQNRIRRYRARTCTVCASFCFYKFSMKLLQF